MCKHAYYVETKADKHDEPLQACEPSMHTCHSVGGRTTENTSCKPQGVHLARAYQSEPYWYQLRQGDGRRTRSKCLNKQSKAENSNFAIGVRASGRKWYQLMRTHTSYKESTQTVHTLWILKGCAGVVPSLDGKTRVVAWPSQTTYQTISCGLYVGTLLPPPWFTPGTKSMQAVEPSGHSRGF